ncbi:unnamed protein product [Clonostachys rosea f. rosea IK726]|uniref:Uncharacterized protein n=1 Tax=Clonostachys rosea f. rosea IK726 TaxID=1349383 RepID=A0ACA9U3E1_BIOOC|nr:unnamed protein product [Clonostachys rosea f. rosea IK726]
MCRSCWTCRSRKVKCDASRPKCHRCIKANIECQGYNVPLYWITDEESHAPSAIKRQAMKLPLGVPHWRAGQINDVDEHLQDVDGYKATEAREAYASGPFGVFTSRSQLPTKPSTSLIDTLPVEDTLMPEIFEEALDEREANTETASIEEDDVIEDVHPHSENALSLYTAGPAAESQDILHICHSLINPFPMLGREDSKDILVQQLMHNYVHNVATVLQPVVHSGNAYSSIYATQAMAVALKSSKNENETQHLGPSNIALNSKTALLYALLTSSAFFLRGSDRFGEADALATSFRLKAQAHLQLALKSLFDPKTSSGQSSSEKSLSDYEGVLSVMLTLVTADVLDGQMNEFWIHLDATKGLVRNLRQHVLPGSQAEHLINISYFLRTLSDSLDVSNEPLPWSRDIYNAPLFLGDGSTLEFTYGVTAKLAGFIRQTCILARNTAYYRSNDTDLPDEFLAAREQLLARISEWHISQEPLVSFSKSDDITLLLISKHILAFATSIRIYYHTRVLPCDQDTLQFLVRSVASQLTEIEDIKKRTGYNVIPTATISWPGFIASCQASASDRPVWAKWWNQMLEYRIGNISNLWTVVQETWALQDSELDDGEPYWAVVLRRRGTRILAI